jgi:hypothetical protein
MINSNNSIKTIVRRFVSLPPHVRMELAARLLRWRDETSKQAESNKEDLLSLAGARTSFLERFWDEVEAAHADGLYTVNPFAARGAHTVLYAAPGNPLGSLLRA